MITPPHPTSKDILSLGQNEKGGKLGTRFQKGPHWGPHSMHRFGLTMRRPLFFMKAYTLNPLSVPHLRTQRPRCWWGAHTCFGAESNNSDSVSYLILRLSWDSPASCLGVLHTEAVGYETWALFSLS